MIVLYGAEIAVADENRETYGFHPHVSDMSVWSKKVLFLQAFNLISKRFTEGAPPLSPYAISQALKLPMRLTRHILYELVGAGLIIKTALYVDGEQAYQPARSTEGMRIQAPIEAYEHIGDDPDAPQGRDGATGWLPFWKGWRLLRQGCPKTCCSKRYEAPGSVDFLQKHEPAD